MTIETIKNNDVYKLILAESCGGIMYNVDNQNKYNATDILQIWNELTDGGRDSAGGIMKGAMDFVAGK